MDFNTLHTICIAYNKQETQHIEESTEYSFAITKLIKKAKFQFVLKM
jgi:hypothetical protein